MASQLLQWTRTVFRKDQRRFGGWFAFGAVLLTALALRLILYTGVLDSDVLEYAYWAFGASQGQIRLDLALGDIGFRYALYLPVALLYSIFGVSDFSTVLYPLLMSLVGVAFIYGIGRLVSGEGAGIIAALLWSILPPNLFLSTIFGPDAIMASLTIGAVFFLLLGERYSGTKSLLIYLGSCFMAFLAILVKPSALIIFVFIVLFFAIRTSPRILRFIRGANQRLSKVWLKGVLIIGLILAGFIGVRFVEKQPVSLLFSLYRAATDFSSLLVLGETQERVSGSGIITNTNLLIVVFPLFLVSFIGLLAKRENKAVWIILWLACLWLYFEWGTISTDPSIYVSFLQRTADRNVLFILAPIPVLAGVYFGKSVDVIGARWLSMAAFAILVPLAWFQKFENFTGRTQIIITAAVITSVLGAFIMVRLNGENKTVKAWITSGYLLITLVAFLLPTTTLHISNSNWQRQANYRVAIRQAADYLLKNPNYPVLVLSDRNAKELNFLSGLQLGHEISALTESRISPRIQVVSDPRTWEDSAYIYLRDEERQISPVPIDWVKMAEFDTREGTPVSIYRTLSLSDAANEICSALQALESEVNLDNWEQLLWAGINAGDLPVTFEAWSNLNRLDPEQFMIQTIAPLIIQDFQMQGDGQPNLLANVKFQSDPELEPFVRITVKNDQARIDVDLPNDLGGQYGIYTELWLRPEIIYVFSATIQSSTGADVVSVMDNAISDSNEVHDTYELPTQVFVVFITPSWGEQRLVKVDLLVVNKQGEITLEHPRLVEFDTHQAD